MKAGSRGVALLCLVLGPEVCLAQYSAPEQPSGYQRPAAKASKYMIVTAHTAGSEAGAAILPNIDSTNGPTLVEKGTAVAGHEDALRKLGHRVKQDHRQSGVSTVMVTPQGLLGGADPRKEGSATRR